MPTAPKTLNPKPYTLHPKTLHPKPYGAYSPEPEAPKPLQAHRPSYLEDHGTW